MSEDNRVTIQYAIDLSEVPASSQKLVDESVGWLRGALAALEDLNFMNEAVSFQTMAEEVDKIRRTLGKTDQRIADCLGIVAGYRQAKIQLSTEDLADPGEVEQGQHQDPSMQSVAADLAAQIKDLREEASAIGGLYEDETK